MKFLLLTPIAHRPDTVSGQRQCAPVRYKGRSESGTAALARASPTADTEATLDTDSSAAG
jgi:hypothetical protein